MKTSKIAALFIASVLGIGATAAMAQSPYGYRSYYNGRVVAPPYAYDSGENRGTAYGAGGTAGTHPTGANVGPGRAQMDHATGP
jgi:hypothetical protein